MNLRPLKFPEDYDGFLLGMKDFVSRMDYHDIVPEKDEHLVEAIQRMYELDAVEFTVVTDNNTLVGFIGMIYTPCIWNHNMISGEELIFWVSPDAPNSTALRLLKASKSRAKERGCELLTYKALTSSPKSIDKVYRAMGLRPTETSYMGVL